MTFRMIKCKLQKKKKPPNEEKNLHTEVHYSVFCCRILCAYGFYFYRFFLVLTFVVFYGVNNVFCSMFHV